MPLLSWTEDDRGSLGDLSTLTLKDDRVDNVLLELIVALALRNEERSAVRAIFPVLIGPAEAGGFGPFPFHKLSRLSTSPSEKTNKLAATILNRLEVSQEKIDDMRQRSVRKTVELILRNQGMQASEVNSNLAPFGSGPGVAFIQTCAIKVLRTVQQELRAMRTDPEQFRNTRPMADEVLDFLRQNCLSSYAMVLANHDIDTLAMLATLTREQVSVLNEEHEQVYPLRGKQGSVGGQMSLQMAVDALKGDSRTLPLSVRLERYRDSCSSAMAALTACNSVEITFTKRTLKGFMFAFGLSSLCITAAATSVDVGLFLAFGCAPHVGCPRDYIWLAMQLIGTVSHLSSSFALMVPLLRSTPLKAYRTFYVMFLAYVFLQLIRIIGLMAVKDSYWPDLLIWCLVFVALVFLVYRQHWFFPYSFVVLTIYTVAGQSLQCKREMEWEGTPYSSCWSSVAANILIFIAPFIFALLFLLVRYIEGRRSAWVKGSRDREMHMAAWAAEVAKAEQSGAMGMLCSCADSIIQELRRQRSLALESFTWFGRVRVCLTQHAGRLSFRGKGPETRQAHSDIDLLFREAASVRSNAHMHHSCVSVYSLVFDWCLCDTHVHQSPVHLRSFSVCVVGRPCRMS